MDIDKQHMIDDDVENSRLEQLMQVQTEAKDLFRRKNTDYGDAFAEYGTIGILVRMGDKIKRLQSISNRGINLVKDEKLRDTLIDLHNYAAMGIMLLDEKTNTEPILETNDGTKGSDFPKPPSIFVKTWNIYGDNKLIYERKTFTDKMNNILDESCSCNSFVFCKTDIKTCKHVKKKYKMAP